MKTRFAILWLLTTGLSVSRADTYNFYWAQDSWADGGLVFMKSGTKAPAGCKVQGLSAAVAANILPPTTNAARNYCDDLDIETTTLQRPQAIGTDWINSTVMSNGECYGQIDRAGAGGAAWMRAFSASAVTAAAYYVDGTWTNLTFGGSDHPCGNVTISNVNPAYAIPFLTRPTTNASADLIVGQVVAASADDNKLAASLLRIRIDRQGGGYSTNIVPNANGTFTNDPNLAGNYSVYAYGISVRAGFPLSTAHVVSIIPEPAGLAFLGFFISVMLGVRTSSKPNRVS